MLVRAAIRRRNVRASSVGFTVLELLVSIGIIGLLLAMLLPAVLYARESARTVTCSNQLRQLGLAVQQHHNWRDRLPAAWSVTPKNPEFAYGWAAQLLPGLETTAMLVRVDLESAPQAPESLLLPLLVCPSDQTEASFKLFASGDDESHPECVGKIPEGAEVLLQTLPTSNYLGVYGTVEADDYYCYLKRGTPEWGDGAVVFDRRVRFGDLERGLTHTLLVGERTMSQVPSTWLGVDLRGEDAECRLVGSAMTRPNCDICDECEFSSRHVGGVYFLWGDGHVSLLANEIDSLAYRRLAQRAAQ